MAVLFRVETKGAYANLALAETLARSRLEARDRAFCAELVYGSIRMRARLDYLLDQLLTRPLAVLPPLIRCLLRVSLYQLEFLPDVAPYAVVDEAVTLAKGRKYPGFAGLVNAVLRGAIHRRGGMVLPEPDEPLRYLSVTLSHPHWLVERWLRRLGTEEAFALARADNQPAPVILRANSLRIGRDRLKALLAEAGVRAESTCYAPEGLRLDAARQVEQLPGYAEGFFLAQDEGAILVGHALQAGDGEHLLDLCAAPGGKTTHLAALSGDRARIIALDDHKHKVELIEDNCRRLGIRGVTALAADARAYRTGDPADGVLLDAPCSGTGVLRRRADLRWRRTPEDLRALVKLQRELLANAATLVRPGGRIVYSTCSLEPEENEEQIRWFQRAFPEYNPIGLRPYLPPPAAVLCGSEPWLYLWPHKQGTDGFFLCRLERRL